MNRIILIGNGFDLAHGLKTSYKDFIYWFWKKNIDNFKRLGIVDNDFFIIPISEYDCRNLEVEKEIKNYQYMVRRLKITFKNKFIRIISEKSSLQNWVDIEEEYYRLLKEIINKNVNYGEYDNIKQLNKDFSCIKTELENYLMEETKKGIGGNAIDFVNETICKNVYSKFESRDLSEIGIVDEKLHKIGRAHV